jgi:hypothetical protein
VAPPDLGSWSEDAVRHPCVRGDTRLPARGHDGRRTARVSNPPLATAGPNWQATRFGPPSPRARMAMYRIPPRERRGRSVRGQLTPRQACPQPNGLGRNLRSKTRWFTGFCNSHHVSHFATFFIDARAEISVAESHSIIVQATSTRHGRGPKPAVFQCTLASISRRVLIAEPSYLQAGRRHGAEAAPPPRRVPSLCAGHPIPVSTMILPQVHLRKPCYDFSFL